MIPIRTWHGRAPTPSQDTACVQAIAGEHGALTRQLAALQQRVSEQFAEYALRVQRLEADVVRLRARLVQARTALVWGLGAAALPTQDRALPRNAPGKLATHDPAMPQASAVICQTGCTGHAHPWLEADGQCRRTGGTCDTLAAIHPRWSKA
jgi:hypothetical protein